MHIPSIGLVVSGYLCSTISPGFLPVKYHFMHTYRENLRIIPNLLPIFYAYKNPAAGSWVNFYSQHKILFLL
jgi:hypothetical protein